ncbi:lipase family protein [Actinomadura physcomitrii]|uniref:lipase family protein n=1 Tax=Actinomadura physcomitrii TaxID=2650748 RepID=UPI002E273EAE
MLSVAMGAATTAPMAAMADAEAAPSGCAATDAAIYTAPSSVDGNPGDLLACRSVALPHVPGNVPMKAWKVQYASTNVQGKKIAVSGTVAVPTATWAGPGSRPVVAFNPGTVGLGSQCAFSKQLAGAYQDEYEGEQVEAFLKAGFAVAATDGVGYLDGQTHTYMAGQNAGHALLDIVRTSRQVPGGSLASDGKVAISGYSEGGAAALWGAQLASSYAPELHMAGVAAGGVPGDLRLVGKQLNGGPFAGFLADAQIGLHQAYPNLPFDQLLNDNGRQAVKNATSNCLYGTLASFLGANVENYTTNHYTLDQLYALKGSDGMSWGDAVDAQKLGADIGGPNSGAKYKMDFPTFQYRGVFEEVIATQAEEDTRSRYCKAGITTQWNSSYPGEHLLTDSIAINDVTAWIGDRFAGKAAPSNCPLF